MAGCSRNPFHALLKRAMVAPSTTLWSAAHDTCMTCAGTRASTSPFAALPAPGIVEAYLGTLAILPMAPMATLGTGMMGEA